MGSQPKPGPGGVSKGMIAVIIAMLAIILVPAAVFSLPTSRLVVTVTNMDTEDAVTCRLNVYGGSYRSSEIFLVPGEEHVWSYSLKPGSYEVYMHYWFESEDYYWRSYSQTVNLSIFLTTEVKVGLVEW